MNKSCIFKILYYISFLLTFLVICGIGMTFSEGVISVNWLLGIFNLILAITFIIKSIKGSLENVNIMFPIIYLIFLIIVVVLALVMNDKLIIPYIHFNYYGMFILFNYLLLNIYSVLSCFKSKNN